MRIRKALEADKEAISQLHTTSIKKLCRTHYSQEQVDAWCSVLTPSAYDHALREKVFLVAECSGGNLLGLGMLDIEHAEISAIYIHPDAVGQGIGAGILRELERIAQRSEIKTITVFSTLNSRGFYERRGYQVEEPALHSLPNGLELECIRMAKGFPASD